MDRQISYRALERMDRQIIFVIFLLVVTFTDGPTKHLTFLQLEGWAHKSKPVLINSNSKVHF